MMIGASGSNSGGSVAVALFVFVGILMYFLPSLIATGRKVPNAGSVFVLNFFLGWTFIGWIVSLAMAFRDRPPAPGPVHVFAGHMPQPRSMAGTPPPRATAGIAPGWYPDPLGHYSRRLHDGQRWTEQVQ